MVAHVVARLGVEVERAGVGILVGTALERRADQVGEEAAEGLRPVEGEQRGPVLRDREGAHAAALLVPRDVVAVEARLEAAHVVEERLHRSAGQELRDQQELVLVEGIEK